MKSILHLFSAANGPARMVMVSVLLGGVVPAVGQPITHASPEQLRQWLKEYPRADANQDGRLTVEEAEAYRRVLERRPSRVEQQPGYQHQYTFATMSDGVKIALAVGYPKGFSRDSDRKWPAIFALCGYAGASLPLDPGGLDNRCVTVNMSIRGTGASGGKLSPWRPRSRQDGHEVIEDWIVKQPWSNGRVGIIGHSWAGLMGLLVATTDPPSLKAICVSGLIEDFYRGIARIGGVRNGGFPVDWLNNYYSPDGPFGSDQAARQVRGLSDVAFRRIVGSRPTRDLRNDFLWILLHQPFDTARMRQLALRTHAPNIRAPILIGQAYQDEQTGTSGWWLWKEVPETVPKRLVLSNGNHIAVADRTGDTAAWLRHWLLQEGDDRVADPRRRVQVYFETVGGQDGAPVRFHRPLEAADFPLPDTRWTRFYLRHGKTFSTDPPPRAEPPDAYRVEHGRLGDDSEWLDCSIKIDKPTAICGPAVLTLWAETTTIDTDFFVLLADRAPDGKLYGLQRGLLRASHRGLDESKSAHVTQDGQQLLIRPWHGHTEAKPVTPHQPCRYQIEIPAVGHVLRPGHALVLRMTRPPAGDPIGVTRSGAPSYRYDSDPPPSTVRVLHDAEHPTSLLLPVLPAMPPPSKDSPPLEKQLGLKVVGWR